MIVGGVAKLNRFPAYEQMVEELDWTDDERQRIGIAELVGGALMLLRPTRRLGAGVVLAASGAALASGAARTARAASRRQGRGDGRGAAGLHRGLNHARPAVCPPGRTELERTVHRWEKCTS